eukprot:8356488-Lingulodinium_polyedra.AAC.1
MFEKVAVSSFGETRVSYLRTRRRVLPFEAKNLPARARARKHIRARTSRKRGDPSEARASARS